MAFDVMDIDLSQLFKNDDTYTIPRYQRNYVWNRTNWMQLIGDIDFCAETTPDWSHFVGSMVFERKKKSGGNVNVIDGQQRLVTFQLVIFSLIYTYKKYLNSEVKSEDYLKTIEINIAYLKDLITNKVLGESQSVKLNISNANFKRINQLLLDDEQDSLAEMDSMVQTKKKGDDLILEGFKFFCNHLNSMDMQKIMKFNKQFLTTRVVTVSSMQEEEVYNIFEILNARGVKLKQAELLKNYMFKYLKPKPLLDTYKEKWNELEVSLDGIDIDDYYLHIFRCYEGDGNTKKEQLFEASKKLLQSGKKEGIVKFFDFFTKYGSMYYNIVNAVGEGIEKEVYGYFKLKINRQIRPVLLMLRVKKDTHVISDELYERCIVYLRNFFIAFNLDNNTSNKIELDVANLSHRILISESASEVERNVLSFLLKFEVYFKENDVLADGLDNIVYTNRSTRKNVSSRLIVYLFKPLILDAETNAFANYDFEEFNVEHILNDSNNENVYYSLGNLLVCPQKINDKMKNKEYQEKRKFLLESKITYLEQFASSYVEFNLSDVDTRSEKVREMLVQIYALPYDDMKLRYDKLSIQGSLYRELLIMFGKDNQYANKLLDMGIDKFMAYLYNNGKLPQEDVDSIKKVIEKVAV